MKIQKIDSYYERPAYTDIKNESSSRHNYNSYDDFNKVDYQDYKNDYAY